MHDETMVLDLVELALSTGRSPEEVCVSTPELLPEVERRLRRCRLVDAELNAIFPQSLEHQATTELVPPTIPGYEIESVLGRGGMGIVYKARQITLGRTVALKVLLAGDFASTSQRVRFLREAEAVAGMKDPAIVQIYDYGHVVGRPYYAMEYVDGGNLAEHLESGHLTVQEAAKYACDLSNAMQQAHSLGIVHRDLKPANILLTMQGCLKVTDFGLARKLDETSRLTLTGDRLGTPCYMAPEQLQGKQDCVGVGTDIYAIGVILYEMLTGRTPFRANTPAETLQQVIQADPVAPAQHNSAVPTDLQIICLKCLEKAPERRYVSCAALSDDLRCMLAGRPISARPIGTIEQFHRWTNRNRVLASALGIGVLVLMSALMLSLVAASHFRQLARENGELAKQKSDLADESERQRKKTEEAERTEQRLRMKAESLADELRRTLYLTEMRLISQTADTPGGMNRLSERLANWELGQSDVREWEWGYLNGLLNQSEAVLPAHAQGVQQVALSPNSDRLLTVGGDHRACVWKVDSRQLLFRFAGHNAPVNSGAWSPKGELAASVDAKGTVCIWKTDTGELVRCWSASESPLQAVAWSPDGGRIATAGFDRSVRVWDASTSELLHELSGHEDQIMAIDWSTAGRLASGALDKKVLVWNLENEVSEIELQGHRGWIRDVKWSPDGQRLASASSDRSAIVWDLQAGGPSLQLTARTFGVKSVAWSPDGKLLATGGDDQLTRIWSADDGKAQQSLIGHSREVNSISWGKVVATGGIDGEVRLWNETRTTGSMRRVQHSLPLHCLKWSPVDPRKFVAGGAVGQLVFCTGSEAEVAVVGDSAIRSISWKSSGESLAILSLDGRVHILDVASRKIVQSLPGKYINSQSIAWSPDGRSIAVGGSEGMVHIWRPSEEAATESLNLTEGSVTTIDWNPDGSQLAVASSLGYVNIYATDGWQEVRKLRTRSLAVGDLAWSPDGSHLAIVAQQDAVEVWRISDGERVALLHGNKSQPAKIAWLANGRRIATAGRDGSIRVWDFDTSREVLVFGEQQHLSNTAVDWSCDGFSLASCEASGDVVIYDAWNGFFAAKSPHLLPTLNQRLLNGQEVDDLLCRGLVYSRMHDVDRASLDFQNYLSRTGQPMIIADCYVSGPYSLAFDRPGPPELARNRNPNSLIPPKAISWKRVPLLDHGFINFERIYDGKANVSGYVYLPIFCGDDIDVTLKLGSDDQLRVWLNGGLIHQVAHSRSAIPEQDRILVRLHQGWNQILVRVANEYNRHILYFEIDNIESATE